MGAMLEVRRRASIFIRDGELIQSSKPHWFCSGGRLVGAEGFEPTTYSV